jgi:hypothetical protein
MLPLFHKLHPCLCNLTEFTDTNPSHKKNDDKYSLLVFVTTIACFGSNEPSSGG